MTLQDLMPPESGQLIALVKKWCGTIQVKTVYANFKRTISKRGDDCTINKYQ